MTDDCKLTPRDDEPVSEDCVGQFGALCYRRTETGATEILLITAGETKRFTIPKGWPVDGRKPHQVAEQEAWEEAGVVGHAKKRPGRRKQGLRGNSTMISRGASGIHEFPESIASFMVPKHISRRDHLCESSSAIKGDLHPLQRDRQLFLGRHPHFVPPRHLANLGSYDVQPVRLRDKHGISGQLVGGKAMSARCDDDGYVHVSG